MFWYDCRMIQFRSLAFVLVAALTTPALAKEEHYQRVRVLLMTEKASCTSCHTSPSSKDLNLYGKALADNGKGDPLADRMLLLDRDPPDNASAADKQKQHRLQDIDGDGVPNWV